MVRITKIEIKNFRAFPRTYQIDLHKAGKNLLVYGENGSGKTSLYLALKLFLESSEDASNLPAFQTDLHRISDRAILAQRCLASVHRLIRRLLY